MKLTYKLSLISSAILATTLIVGCGDKAPKTAPDVAIKEANAKFLDQSFNYTGKVTSHIVYDEKALIGTAGGLSQELADEELSIADELTGPNGKETIEMLKKTQLSFHGAYDKGLSKSEVIINTEINQGGMSIAIEIPMAIDYTTQPTLFVDPKAAKAFGVLPPQFDNKLIRLSVNDFPELSEKHKANFAKDGIVLKKLKEFSAKQLDKVDGKLFQDIEVSAEDKAEGVVRSIKLVMTPDLSKKVLDENINSFLDEVLPAFDVSAEEIADAKQEIQSGNQFKAFYDNNETVYGLDDKGNIIKMVSKQGLKGAKHVGDFTVTVNIKDFGKPTFTIDTSRESIGIDQLAALGM